MERWSGAQSAWGMAPAGLGSEEGSLAAERAALAVLAAGELVQDGIAQEEVGIGLQDKTSDL